MLNTQSYQAWVILLDNIRAAHAARIADCFLAGRLHASRSVALLGKIGHQRGA